MIDRECRNDEQCHQHTNHTVCVQVTLNTSFCKCKEGYQSLIQPDYIVCVQVPVRTSSVLYPSSLASICVLLSLLAFLLCFIIRLFNKNRFSQHRPCTDAALTPIIRLEGKELIVAESVEMLSTSSASPASDSRTYSPGPVLTPDDLRKMSLLSSLSVTIPLDEDTFSVRAVSPTGCRLSPEHIIPQTAASNPVDHLEHIEQSVTIIPNLRAKEARRKSMANYAFPELHPEVKLEEPSKNLLIFTQTGVDSAGRRHSVSIPLLPLSGSKTRPSPSQEKPLVTIQRKGSHHGQHRRNSSRNMESINESTRGSNRSIPKSHEEISMDCLTVPSTNTNLLQPSPPRRMSRKMSPRQNSLPARPSSARGASPTSGTRSHGSLRGGSFHRPAKQDFYQFLDSAIAH